MLDIVHRHCAGIDIGAEQLFVSIYGSAAVHTFDTFTASYQSLIAHLIDHKVTSVAMEATGIYWYSLYEQLEAAGLEVYLVNSRHIKFVPGRKSDVQDCQWLQQLHSYGLLRRSFIPDDLTRQLRTYTRLRETHLDSGATCILRMQKALTAMNLRLHQVISQITGVSGLRILKAILSGERDAEVLADLCVEQIRKNKRSEVVLSLQGYYKEEHLFALDQALQAYEFFEKQRLSCDKKIGDLLEKAIDNLQPPQEEGKDPAPPSELKATTKAKTSRHHPPKIEQLHHKLVHLNDGKDVAQIAGLSDSNWLKLMGEVGTDLSKWETSSQFVSWLGLAPKKDKSGKRAKRAKGKSQQKAGQIFKEAAFAISNSKNLAIGLFYRGIKARRGALIANVATARKIAIQFYNLLRYGTQYVEQGIEAYEQKVKELWIRKTQKAAKKLGFTVVLEQN